MKKLTNHQPGARGVNLKDGTTRWIEPGETAEIDAKDIAGDLPDLGKAPTTKDDAELAEALDAENAELKAKVAELEKQIADLKKPAKA
jgi:polyhydroxyalkanoate synthesis regulator phasin